MYAMFVSDGIARAFEEAIIAQMPMLVGGGAMMIGVFFALIVAYFRRIIRLLEDNGQKLDDGNKNTKSTAEQTTGATSEEVPMVRQSGRSGRNE